MKIEVDDEGTDFSEVYILKFLKKDLFIDKGDVIQKLKNIYAFCREYIFPETYYEMLIPFIDLFNHDLFIGNKDNFIVLMIFFIQLARDSSVGNFLIRRGFTSVVMEIPNIDQIVSNLKIELIGSLLVCNSPPQNKKYNKERDENIFGYVLRVILDSDFIHFLVNQVETVQDDERTLCSLVECTSSFGFYDMDDQTFVKVEPLFKCFISKIRMDPPTEIKVILLRVFDPLVKISVPLTKLIIDSGLMNTLFDQQFRSCIETSVIYFFQLFICEFQDKQLDNDLVLQIVKTVRSYFDSDDDSITNFCITFFRNSIQYYEFDAVITSQYCVENNVHQWLLDIFNGSYPHSTRLNAFGALSNIISCAKDDIIQIFLDNDFFEVILNSFHLLYVDRDETDFRSLYIQAINRLLEFADSQNNTDLTSHVFEFADMVETILDAHSDIDDMCEVRSDSYLMDVIDFVYYYNQHFKL